MHVGLVKLGACFSGLKAQTPRFPLVSRVFLATPRALGYCYNSDRVKQAMNEPDFNRPQEYGLQFNCFYNRNGEKRYGLQLAYFDAAGEVLGRFPKLRGQAQKVAAEEEREHGGVLDHDCLCVLVTFKPGIHIRSGGGFIQQ